MARKDRKDRGLFVYTTADGSEWFGVRLYAHGRAHKWQGFRRKQDARNWYDDRKKDLREHRPFPPRHGESGPTLADIIAHYLAQATDKKNYAGEQVYGKFWTQFLGEQSLANLSAPQIDRARTHLLAHGSFRGPLSHSTVNRYLAWLHHVCALEVRKGTLPANPCQLKKFKEPSPPEVEFSHDEERALARELGPYACVPSLAILTGLRQEELLTLRWDDLDLERGYGKLRTPKSGKPEVFLINRDARDLLERRDRYSVWVFPNEKNPHEPVNHKSWYNNRFKPAAKRAGIVLSRKSGKTFHTLRHTFAARLQQAGVEVKDIKDLGRWKSWKAMERYLKRDHGRLRSAIERLQTRTTPEPPLIRESKTGSDAT